jgi:cytoskeletal protein RodZ
VSRAPRGERAIRAGTAIERVVGRRLREARLGRDMTLADVAAKTGLSTGILSKIENAKVSSCPG